MKTKTLLLLFGLALSGCTVRHETPDLRGQDVRLTVFHTSDIHSRLLPYNFAPGRNDQDLGLDPDACKAWACGEMSTAAADARPRAELRTGCRRVEIDSAKVAAVAGRAGLAGPEAVTCEVLTARYANLCRVGDYPGACVSDGNGGFVTWDCTCNYGGIGRIATVLRTERASAGRSLHLDSGDCFQGAPIFNLFAGEVEFRTLSAVGLDAAALGNHEFDKGATNLASQIVNWASFPIMAANYEFERPNDFSRPWLGTVTQPYTIFNVDGLKVGVIGMGNLSSLQGIYEAGNSLGIRPLATDEVVRQYVQLLRPQVDLLVITSHLGLDEDEGVAVNEVIGKGGSGEQNEAAALAGVDVIFGGHLHIALNPPKLIPQRDASGDPTGFNTVLVHSGAFAKYVGRLDLVVHVGDPAAPNAEQQRSHVKSYTYDLIPIDARVASDGDMLRIVEPYEIKLNQSLDLTKTFSFVGTSDRSKIYRNDASGGDSQIGNLVTLSMRVRKRVEADFALTNSLGVRADFEYGALTLEQMYNVFPFENSITTMFLSGGEVREMLDFVARKSADRGCRTQAQVSGIAFDMVCRRPSGCADPTLPKSCSLPEDCGDPNYVFCNEAGACRKQAACSDAIFVGDGCNVCDPSRPEASCCNRPELGLECRCQPLNPYGTYKVAVNDYIAAGGSGFLVLKRNTTKFNTGISLRDALIDYLRQLPSRCADLIADWNVTVPAGGRPLATDLACIDLTVEPHDGRVTPVLE
ncbi:MAG: bifunctional metallophosphatase/5'-nucleotidase [Deltaproteobacteria bacterium]|nr:bifunctional metallophosphatase/5'-nucleotidase [Deltaproteobacteria bacterium]